MVAAKADGVGALGIAASYHVARKARPNKVAKKIIDANQEVTLREPQGPVKSKPVAEVLEVTNEETPN